MSTLPKYPSLYQVNTRVLLTDLTQNLGRQATLDDIPDTELDRLASMGFDWIWFLSVWTTGDLGRKVSRENPEWQQEFENTLPDLQEKDIGGSGFAIAGYNVHPDLGGDDALKRLHDKLGKRGLKLMLDFVPNHMGPDHPWVEEHPDFFVSGTESDLEKYPQNFTKIKRKQGDMILAFGRDPYFDGWPDTLQLDYSNPATVGAMIKELLRISGQCDGVRCDMAMLILPEIFDWTWGRKAQPFWPLVTTAVREKSPGFCFMAEVYWDMEWTLQQQGFDYAYDKRLYDRLCEGNAGSVRGHFCAALDYQTKLARFLENHDEPRAVSKFEPDKHKAAAVITFLSPGLRFFHQGQFEGRKKRISPHLVRAPQEEPDEALQKFYTDLLSTMNIPLLRSGNWQLLECMPAWEGNDTWDSFLTFGWSEDEGKRMIICVNYSDHQSQCYVNLPFDNLSNCNWQLKDLMGDSHYEYDGNNLQSRGLYLDMKPWEYHVFEMEIVTAKSE